MGTLMANILPAARTAFTNLNHVQATCGEAAGPSFDWNFLANAGLPPAALSALQTAGKTAAQCSATPLFTAFGAAAKDKRPLAKCSSWYADMVALHVTAPRCACAGGEAAWGAACPKAGDGKCVSCRAGFRLSRGRCVFQRCEPLPSLAWNGMLAKSEEAIFNAALDGVDQAQSWLSRKSFKFTAVGQPTATCSVGQYLCGGACQSCPKVHAVQQ